MTTQRTLYALLHRNSDVRLNSKEDQLGLCMALLVCLKKSWIDLSGLPH